VVFLFPPRSCVTSSLYDPLFSGIFCFLPQAPANAFSSESRFDDVLPRKFRRPSFFLRTRRRCMKDLNPRLACTCYRPPFPFLFSVPSSLAHPAFFFQDSEGPQRRFSCRFPRGSCFLLWLRNATMCTSFFFPEFAIASGSELSYSRVLDLGDGFLE